MIRRAWLVARCGAVAVLLVAGWPVKVRCPWCYRRVRMPWWRSHVRLCPARLDWLTRA